MALDGIHKTGGFFSDASERRENSFFTVLVLDSNYAVDQALENFLKGQGYAFLMASSAEEALEKTFRFEPNLILLDCELKGVKGLALLPELLEAQPKAAVILLASRPSVSNVVEAMNLGAVDFFERPLDLARLKAAMDFQRQLFGSP